MNGGPADWKGMAALAGLVLGSVVVTFLAFVGLVWLMAWWIL